VPFYKQDLETTDRAVSRCAGSSDSATNDDDVKLIAGINIVHMVSI